jgi:hypothetical protein
LGLGWKPGRRWRDYNNPQAGCVSGHSACLSRFPAPALQPSHLHFCMRSYPVLFVFLQLNNK